MICGPRAWSSPTRRGQQVTALGMDDAQLVLGEQRADRAGRGTAPRRGTLIAPLVSVRPQP